MVEDGRRGWVSLEAADLAGSLSAERIVSVKAHREAAWLANTQGGVRWYSEPTG